MDSTPQEFKIREIRLKEFKPVPKQNQFDFIICQLRLFLERKPYIIAGKTDSLWRRLSSALELSQGLGADFFLAPEYTLPFSKLSLFIKFIQTKANNNSVYCIPVEHLVLEQLQQLTRTLNLNPKAMDQCFPPNLDSTNRYARLIFNVAIIAIKDNRGKISFHLQPKIFPALLEESENMRGCVFQGGNVINVFRTPLISFAVTICFDFIGQDGVIPNAIRNWLNGVQNRLDFLFVLQVNPKPLHRIFERNLHRFVSDPACRFTSLFFVNCDSASYLEGSGGERVEGFNKSAVLAKFELGYTDEYQVEKSINIPPEKTLGQEIFELDWMQRLILSGQGERIVWLKSSTLTDWRSDVSYPRKNHIHLYACEKGALARVPVTTGFEFSPIRGPLEEVPASEYRPITIRKPARFVGRSQEISRVLEFFDSNRRCLLIYGEPGIGKSVLVQYVADRLLSETPKRFSAGLWFSAKDRPLSLKQFISEIAESLDYPAIKQLDETEQKSEIIRTLKNKLKKNSIIIFDNIETIRDPNMLAFIRELSKYGKIILTSRNATVTSNCLRYELGPMGPKDLELLAQDHFPGLSTSSLRRLSRFLGGSPLALNLLFGYLKTEKSVTLDETMVEIESSGKNVVDWVFHKSWSSIGSRGQMIINALQVFADTFTEEALRAITKLPITRVGEFFKELNRRYLIEAVQYPNAAHPRFQIHPLVRRFSETEEPRAAVKDRCISYYARFVKDHCEAEDFTGIEPEIRNIEGALNLCVIEGMLDSYLKILSHLYYYYYERGFWNDVIDHCSKGYSYARKVGSLRYSIEMSSRISWCAFRKENLQLARHWLKISKRELNESKQRFPELTGFIEETDARILLTDGKISAAVAQCRIENAIQRYRSLSHIKAATLQARALSYLGEMHLEERNYKKALEMFTEVKKLAEKYRKEKFATKVLAWTLGNIGETLLLQSEDQLERTRYLETCINLFNDGLALARQIDRQHTIAQCCWGLGVAMLALGYREGTDYLSSARYIYLRLGRKSKVSNITAILTGSQRTPQP